MKQVAFQVRSNSHVQIAARVRQEMLKGSREQASIEPAARTIEAAKQ
jgi:hypothetical protein